LATGVGKKRWPQAQYLNVFFVDCVAAEGDHDSALGENGHLQSGRGLKESSCQPASQPWQARLLATTMSGRPK
jgi:hypothetical protein